MLSLKATNIYLKQVVCSTCLNRFTTNEDAELHTNKFHEPKLTGQEWFDRFMDELSRKHFKNTQDNAMVKRIAEDTARMASNLYKVRLDMTKKGYIGKLVGVPIAIEHNSDGSVTICDEKEMVQEILLSKECPEWLKDWMRNDEPRIYFSFQTTKTK